MTVTPCCQVPLLLQMNRGVRGFQTAGTTLNTQGETSLLLPKYVPAKKVEQAHVYTSYITVIRLAGTLLPRRTMSQAGQVYP